MNEVEAQKQEASDSAPRAANGTRPPEVTSTRPANDLESQRIADKAGALVMQARRAARSGKKAEAKKLLQQALAISPTDIGALELLGDIFMEDAEQEKAQRVFEHGLKHHPGHRAFEEKIALCIVDIEEMKRHRERSQALIEIGDTESWMNLSGNRAAGLSILLPGAGHVYAEENERAAWIFGSYIFALLGWTVPLYYGVKSAAAQNIKGLDNGISHALSNMSAAMLMWFWLMVAIGVGVFVFASIDSFAAVERANDRRKHGFEEFGF